MDGEDKIWARLGEHPVVWHSVVRLARHATRAVLVVQHDRVASASAYFSDLDLAVVAGGPERRDSVANGIRNLGPVDAIAIHDAARPFATSEILRRGARLLRTHHAAIPTVPVTDTIKRVAPGGSVVATLERRDLVAAQTPQLFRAESLLRAHEELRSEAVTDDAQLIEALGLSVASFAGDVRNIKITTPHDLEIACFIMSQERTALP